MFPQLKYVLAVVIFLAGIGTGYKLFHKPDVPPPAATASVDKSKEKKSGTIIKYLPSKCDGAPQEIASIEKFDSELKNDISAESKPLPALMNTLYGGPGISNSWKLKGMIGGSIGHHGAAATSDGDKDHAIFYNWVYHY